MKDDNKKRMEYNYKSLTFVAPSGHFMERSVYVILDNNFLGWKKKWKIEFLNDLIHDVEHYRDNL